MRILVTRPEPDCQHTAASLRQRGHEVLVLPMLRIEAMGQAHLGAGPWAAVLFTSGDADTRVPPEQARKMAARVQAASKSGLPVLLLYDTKAGHSGGRPFRQIIDEQSLKLAFLASELGMK